MTIEKKLPYLHDQGQLHHLQFRQRCDITLVISSYEKQTEINILDN